MRAASTQYRFVSAVILSFVSVFLAVSSARAADFQVNNYTNAGDPFDPGTIFLGDTNVTFRCNAWGSLGGQQGGAQIWIDSDSNVQDGYAGADFVYVGTDEKANTSAQFRSVGIWYWAVLMRYNTSPNQYGWYCSDTDGTWTDEVDPPSGSIAVTVNALNPASNQTATANSPTQITLDWDRGVSGTAKNTLIFRYTNNVPPAPAQGTSYTGGNDYSFGGRSYRAVYNNSGESHPDTGLAAETAYHYFFYAENDSYYSPGVFTNATTAPAETNNAAWDGGDDDDNWSSVTNWIDDARPASSNTTVINFTNSTGLTPYNDYTAWTEFDSLKFNGGAGAYTIGGNAFKIDNKIENNSANLQTINNDLALSGATVTEVNPVDGNLTLNGTVYIDNNGELQVWGTNGHTLAFNGSLTNGAGSSGKLTIKQNSVVELNAANGFDGEIVLEAGTLKIGHDAAVDSAGVIRVGPDGGIDPAEVLITATAITVPNTVVARAGAAARRIGGSNTGGTATYSGQIHLDNNATLTATDGTVDFKEVEDGAGPGEVYGCAVNVSGSGKVRFSGSNANGDLGGRVIADFTVEEGTLELAKDSGVNAISADTDIEDGGILLLAQTHQIDNVKDVEVESGGTFNLAGYNEEIGSIHGAGNITLGTAQLTAGGNGGSGTFSGVMSGTGGSFVKKGGGALTLSNTNTFSAGAYIDNGTLALSNADTLDASTIGIGEEATGADNATLSIAGTGITVDQATIDVRDGTGSRTISADGSGTATVSGSVDLNTNLTVNAASGSLDFSGGIDLDHSGNNDLIVTGAQDVTISGKIGATSDNSSIEMDGSGTLTISGNNTGEDYQLNISGGTVVMGGNSTFGTTDGDGINFNTADSTLRVTADANPASLGMHIAGNVTPTFQVDPGSTFTVAGVINDNGDTSDIRKTGTGTLMLQAANLIDGTTEVDTGTLHMALGSSIASAVDVNSSGTLKGQGTVGALIVAGTVAPGASVGTLNTTANTTWTNNGSYVWEINNFAGAYGGGGTSNGWDKLDITGTLTIAATAGNPFTIDVTSLNGNATGPAAGFISSQGYTQSIATASVGISGFSTNKFIVDYSNFQNGGGSWSVTNTANTIDLVFTSSGTVSTNGTLFRFR